MGRLFQRTPLRSDDAGIVAVDHVRVSVRCYCAAGCRLLRALAFPLRDSPGVRPAEGDRSVDDVYR